MEYIMWFVSAALAVFGYAIVLHAPMKKWWVYTVVGGVMFVIFNLLLKVCNEKMSLLIICFLTSLISMIMAKHFRMVSMAVVSTVIITLVPGYSIFRGISKVIRGQYGDGMSITMDAMILVIIMVIGLWLGFSVFKIVNDVIEKQKKRKLSDPEA